MKGIYVYVLLAVIAVVIVSGTYYLSSPTQSTPLTSKSTSQANIQLTDPANVPFGTSSLLINYSDVYAQVVTNGSSKWINENAAGSIDLLKLANQSILLAIFNVSNGSSIDKVGFNVSSALITINGSTYTVLVPNKRFLANVTGISGVNGSVNVLIDLSPTIVTIETTNTSIFILVPSLKAVIEHVSSTKAHMVGEKSSISEAEHRLLSYITPNISITSAALSVSGNVTNLYVVVKDNSNRSAILNGLNLFGQMNITLNRSAVHEIANYSVQENRVANPGITQSTSARGVSGNNSLDKNATSSTNETEINKEVNTTEIGILRNETKNVAEFSYMRTIHFLIHPNGTLFVPFDRPEAVLHPINKSLGGAPGVPVCANFPSTASNRTESDLQNSLLSCLEKTGFTVNASQSATLTFSGVLDVGFGSLVIRPITGDNYRLLVNGERGSFAYYNLTAS